MTEQEAFDKVVRGLASQGFRRSFDDNPTITGVGSCVYNGPEGRHCAAGWLLEGIPLDAGENKTYIQVLIHRADVRERLQGLSPDFLDRLQCAHDAGKTPSDMVDRLRAFAKNWDLSDAVLGEWPA